MTTPDTLPSLEAIERRSVAVRALQHRAWEAVDHYCGWCLPGTYGGVNLGLSNVCQAGHHDLCAGQVVVSAPGAPWSCGCLCHHARDRERDPRAPAPAR